MKTSVDATQLHDPHMFMRSCPAWTYIAWQMTSFGAPSVAPENALRVEQVA